MNLDLSGLEEVAEKPGKKSAKRVWEPVDLTSFRPGVYVGCDQSLTATGIVVLLLNTAGQVPEVILATSFATEQGPVGGHEDLLVRTHRVQTMMEHDLNFARLFINGWGEDQMHFAHEAPPVGGGKFLRPEVSLLTAYAFRSAVRIVFRLPVEFEPQMIRRQDHAWLMCGNGNVKTKTEYHKPMQQRVLPQLVNGNAVTNEAKRDALSIALALAVRVRDGK